MITTAPKNHLHAYMTCKHAQLHMAAGTKCFIHTSNVTSGSAAHGGRNQVFHTPNVIPGSAAIASFPGILSHSCGEIKSGRKPKNEAIAVCGCRNQVFRTPNVTPGLATCSGMNQVFQFHPRLSCAWWQEPSVSYIQCHPRYSCAWWQEPSVSHTQCHPRLSCDSLVPRPPPRYYLTAVEK